VPGAPNWDKAIRDAIAQSDVGLFVMSHNSLTSNICAGECQLVRELGKPLYIARLEAVGPQNVWLDIKRIQYADLVADFEAGLHKLIAALRGDSVDADAPQAARKFTGIETLRAFLQYALVNPMRGRDADLAKLKAMLNGGGIAQIIGTGGIGKSRLAAEAAFQHTSGTIWHRCSPTSQVADALVLIAQHLDIALTSKRAEIMAALTQRPALVVIDNAEDVPAEDPRRAEYDRLLAELAACHTPIILTSRTVWTELKPRKDLTPIALDLTTATLITRDFAESDGTTLTESESQTLAQAARLYPRLIEFAVGQLKEREFERVVKILHELKSRDAREALDEMILKTVRQMVEQERDGASAESLLRQLTVCVADFDRATLSALAPSPLDEDEDALDDALAVLRRWRFVTYDESARRYSVGDMVRAALPADEAAFLRYAAYFTEQAEQFDTRPPQDWRDTIERDLLHVLAVGDRLVERQEKTDFQDMALEFATNTTDFVFRRMEHQRRAWLEMGLALSRAVGNVKREGLFLNQLGLMWSALGEKRKALDYYEQALPVDRELGNRAGEATTLNNIGAVWDELGEKHKALDYYEQALPITRAVGDRAGEAVTCFNIVMIYDSFGDLDKAIAYVERCVELDIAVSHPDLESDRRTLARLKAKRDGSSAQG